MALWAVIPPLLLVVYYYYRIPTAPSLLRLLLFLIFGAISGLLALSLEWVFETAVNLVVDWQKMQRVFLGVALRQLLEISPIEESCKLMAVIVPTYYLQRRYQLRPSTIFLFTIAAALGFDAEESWIYLSYDTASILERLIGTPVHALLSSPWGYALAISIGSNIRSHDKNRKLLASSWLNSVICHALVNTLSSAGSFTFPLRLLSYGLFPFFLWMFWRLEQLLRRVQAKIPLTLISGNTPYRRYWQRGLVVFALMLGGNAFFGLFLLAKKLEPLSPSQLFYPDILLFILRNLTLNLIFGFLAWFIYQYLRRAKSRKYI
ncbi:MAG: PrsW family glutamic-type intramembrane protease [Rhizonema sp. NSF051]|nr:PrsW family glutamic-type intramembrane protease [Rhizonema sp. NSF051]